MSIIEVSVRGKKEAVRSYAAGSAQVIVKGGILKVAEVFDEYWLEARRLPDPLEVVKHCRLARPKPDIFTFAQRVPDTMRRYEFATAWDNVAVIPLSSYDEWFGKQITSATRRNIRAAQNRGVAVNVSAFNEWYVRGIMAIYNETPIRQGRRFWHYGKDFETVRADNGTYADRSTFLAAIHNDEMIGYLKIVWDEQTAAIMQVMSKMRYYDRRPNNALLAEAIRLSCARGVRYLLYESFVYGNNAESSLTEFKRNNGFVRMDVPRYFVPLTWKGVVGLKLGLHINQKDRLPPLVITQWSHLRAKWYGLKRRPGDALKDAVNG
jgi:hypothetical protein